MTNYNSKVQRPLTEQQQDAAARTHSLHKQQAALVLKQLSDLYPQVSSVRRVPKIA